MEAELFPDRKIADHATNSTAGADPSTTGTAPAIGPPPSAVRAKFTVQDRTEHGPMNAGGWSVRLSPVIGGSPEDQAFWEATPGGELTLQVVSGETAALFTPGTDLYVTFTAVEPAAPPS